MNKVKYTRMEYRKEYLKSPEWKQLRDLVMKANPKCQCCQNKQATDAHHMTYRNIVDIQPSDLLPVCRECHDYIHQAIRDGYISQNPYKIHEIRNKTKHILYDEEYEKLKTWLAEKHTLSADEQTLIKSDKRFIYIKVIRGLTKKNITLENLDLVKFTGRQLLQIRKSIKTFLYRQKYGLDKEKRASYSKKYRQRW